MTDARLREADRMCAAAEMLGETLRRYQAEFEATGEEYSIPNFMVRSLLASPAMTELRHAAAAYRKARGE